jgi:hypothetical protein
MKKCRHRRQFTAEWRNLLAFNEDVNYAFFAKVITFDRVIAAHPNVYERLRANQQREEPGFAIPI